MDSPLARVILPLLGGYLIILLFLSVYDWIVEEYPRRPSKPPSSERIQQPFYHEEAVKVLQQFSRLPKSEKAAIRENLESSLISMEQWLTHLSQSDYQIICIGELHEESTRNFLAEEFFAKFSTDVLLLEVTPKDLKRLTKRMDAGRDYFPLLDADIMNILRTVKDRNPAIKIWGIEETDEQQKDKRGHSNSRDQSIAHNFWDRFQPGRRHIILFGALHCTLQPRSSLSKRTDAKRASTGRTSKWTIRSLCVFFRRDRNRKKKLCHSRHQCTASPYLRIISVAKTTNSGKVLFPDCFPYMKLKL